MIDMAYAQASPGAGGPGPLVTILPFILIFVIMYFMVIRPHKKEPGTIKTCSASSSATTR